MEAKCLRVGSLVQTVHYPLTACVRVVSFIHRFRVVCCSPPRAAPLRARLLGWGVPTLHLVASEGRTILPRAVSMSDGIFAATATQELSATTLSQFSGIPVHPGEDAA